MIDEHFIVLGVARARVPWLADVGRWSTSSTLPIEFIRCVSVDEVRARLSTDRRHSAVLLDERCTGVDRDLLWTARDATCAPLVVTGSAPLRDWGDLGAACVLQEPLTPDAVLAALRDHALGVERRSAAPASAAIDAPLARMLAVTGAGGTGTSTLAMALAGRLGATSDTALIDGALDADLALLHDLGDVLPGLPELVDAHRTATPTPDLVRENLWQCPNHGYDVLPGLRRHRDWTTMRRRNVSAAIRSVRAAYDMVVADTDLDLEGESDTGSVDIEDRNMLARELLTTSDVVVVTARPGLAGIRRLVRGLTHLLEHDIEARRIVPVVVGAPRSTTRRSELTRTLARLLAEIHPDADRLVPVMVPIRRDLEPFLHDAGPLPSSVVGSVATAARIVLDSTEPIAPATYAAVRVVPGHLGRTA